MFGWGTWIRTKIDGVRVRRADDQLTAICGFRRSRPRIPMRKPATDSDLKPAGGSDLMSATWRLLPRIEVMMFRPVVLVKRPWIWASVNCEEGSVQRDGSGGGGQRRAKRAFHCVVAEPVAVHGLGPRRRLGGRLTLVGHVDFKATISRLRKLSPARSMR